MAILEQIAKLTPAEYQALRDKINRFDEETLAKFPPRGRSGMQSWPADYPFDNPAPTNAERGIIESFEFEHNPPLAYVVYVNEGTTEEKYKFGEPISEPITWVGNRLASRITWGKKFRDNFGGVRVAMRFRSPSGFDYAGFYAKSAGQYARVRICKPCRGWRWDMYATGWNDCGHSIVTYPKKKGQPLDKETKGGFLTQYRSTETVDEYADRLLKLTEKLIGEPARKNDSYLAGCLGLLKFY